MDRCMSINNPNFVNKALPCKVIKSKDKILPLNEQRSAIFSPRPTLFRRTECVVFLCCANSIANLWASAFNFWSYISGDTPWRRRFLLCSKRNCCLNLAIGNPRWHNKTSLKIFSLLKFKLCVHLWWHKYTFRFLAVKLVDKIKGSRVPHAG